MNLSRFTSITVLLCLVLTGIGVVGAAAQDDDEQREGEEEDDDRRPPPDGRPEEETRFVSCCGEVVEGQHGNDGAGHPDRRRSIRSRWSKKGSKRSRSNRPS